MLDLTYIIENEFFITCPFLSTDQFITYCRDRDIQTSREQLEQFEKLGIFYPIARVKYPKINIKIEYVDDGKRYRDLGILKDGEEWIGDIKEEYANFWFEKEIAKNWFEEGLLWEPSTQSFKSWETFKDENKRTQIESFYSIFQCYILYHLIQLTTMRIGAEWWAGYSKENIENITNQISDWAKKVTSGLQKGGIRDKAIPICQIISNRYFPQTQSDRRTIQVPFTLLTHPKWDWDEYCRNWDAKKILAEIGISIDELERLHETVVMDTRFADPLEQWYGLISFISVAQKKN